MKWQKRGLVYVPRGHLWWARTHAMLPTADVRDDCIRVYFTSLDASRFGRIGFVDLDRDDPQRILSSTAEPVLDLGDRGTFDDSGVNASCVLTRSGQKHLYYIGWQRADRVPYMLFAGLAIGDGQTFAKQSRTPILDRTPSEPFTRSAPMILQDGPLLRMWYVSVFDWIEVDDRTLPTYVVRCVESSDGVKWSAGGPVCIALESEDEFGFGRPWVVKDGRLYRMWYSIRSRTRPYRLGFAQSADGLHWVRKDHEVGISASDSGWDSEMICYPCVVDVNGRRYMFYNGNRHGESGFGCAELLSE